MWVATEDLPRSAAHPFYARLNQILDQHDFDLLIHTGGFNLGLLMRQLIGVGTPRGLQGRLSLSWRLCSP